MNFKYFLTTALTFFVFNFLFINNSTAQGGISFRSPDGMKIYEEDNVLQFSIKVLNEKLNNLSRDFERAKSGDRAVQPGLMTLRRGTNINPISANLTDYEVAGFCFVPIKQYNQINGNIHSFYTKGFHTVLALWKSIEDDNGIAQPKEVVLYFDDTPLMVEQGLPYLENTLTETVQGVLSLTSESNDVVDNRIQTSQYNDAADSIVFKTREFELVFLDIGTYRDLATNNNFYSSNSSDVNLVNGKPQRNIQGILIERSFLSLNPLTLEETFDFQNYRSLVFKPLPVPNLASDYDAESAFTFTHGFSCPPYWRPDGTPSTAPSPVALNNTSSPDDVPTMLRFFQQPDTINHLSLSLLSIARDIQNSRLNTPPKKPQNFWEKYLEKYWFLRCLIYLLALLGLIFSGQKLFNLIS